MEANKKADKEKNRFIFLAVVALILIIGLIAAAFILSNKREIKNKNLNILYVQGNVNLSQEENVMQVELPNESHPNANENQNENNVEINEQNEQNKPNEPNKPAEKPKVNAPYYIKVNNQANVVTVYKKDNKREIHGTN